jgi:hypothetical protein
MCLQITLHHFIWFFYKIKKISSRSMNFYQTCLSIIYTHNISKVTHKLSQMRLKISSPSPTPMLKQLFLVFVSLANFYQIFAKKIWFQFIQRILHGKKMPKFVRFRFYIFANCHIFMICFINSQEMFLKSIFFSIFISSL